MHAIAPRTIQSGEAADHGRERHGGHARPAESDGEKTAARAGDSAAHTVVTKMAEPARDRPPAELAILDEGDVVLHVIGTGMGPSCSKFVCRVATRLRLRGWVRCEAGALTIRAVGREPELALLVHELLEHAPVDASIRSIEPDVGDGGAALPERGFVIISGDFSGHHESLPPAPVPAAVPDW